MGGLAGGKFKYQVKHSMLLKGSIFSRLTEGHDQFALQLPPGVTGPLQSTMTAHHSGTMPGMPMGPPHSGLVRHPNNLGSDQSSSPGLPSYSLPPHFGHGFGQVSLSIYFAFFVIKCVIKLLMYIVLYTCIK